MRPLCLVCAAIIIAIPLALSPAARAEEKSAAAMRAEELFDEGRLLMTVGDFAAACPKFAESQTLDPAPGTILNLAVCYERANKLASAWSGFRTAEATAQAVGQKAREKLAHQKSEALQPKLSRLTVNVPADAQVYGLEIRCNGVGVRPTDFGVAIPYDGGRYVIEAAAAGKKTWTKTIELNPSGESAELSVPALADAPAPPPPQPEAPPRPVVLPPPEKPSTAIDDIERSIAVNSRLQTRVEHPGAKQRTVGLLIGAAGLVTMGVVSVALGATAKSKYDVAMNEPGQMRHDDSIFAVGTGNVGTLVFGVGAIVTLVGCGVWVTAPKDTTVVVTAGAGGLSLSGSFQ
jgi:hypothetical protein